MARGRFLVSYDVFVTGNKLVMNTDNSVDLDINMYGCSHRD